MKTSFNTGIYYSPATQNLLRQPAEKTGDNTRFGNAAKIGKWLGKMYADPTGNILIVDLVGFGFVRTTLDLFREYLFKKTDNGKRHLNYMAARERIVREAGCIFIANFLGGVMSNNAAKIANGLGYTNMVRNYASLETLKMFEHGLQKGTTPEALYSHIAKTISPEHANFISEQFKRVVAAGGENTNVVYDAANKILRKISPGKNHYDMLLKVGQNTHEFQLDTLLKDTAGLMSHVPSSGSWHSHAKKLVSNTLTFNKFSIPTAMATVLTLTILVPFWNVMFTRKHDQVNDYPGLKGLKDLTKIEAKDSKLPWYERTFPYLTQSLRKGDLFPTFMSLLPLPFALGITNNINMGQGFWKAPGYVKGFLNAADKGFFSRALSMFQFGKVGLNTTGQQVAAVCAMVCAARQAMSRNKIEFRERTIDASGAWVLWLVAVPLLSKAIARGLDAKLGTKIIKDSPIGQTFRNGAEISNLLPKNIAAKTARVAGQFHKWLTISTILLVGIVEPLAAIKWSEYQVRKDKEKERQKAAALKPFQPTIMPQPQMLQG